LDGTVKQAFFDVGRKIASITAENEHEPTRISRATEELYLKQLDFLMKRTSDALILGIAKNFDNDSNDCTHHA
jgi:hypothetical protein